MKKKLALCMTFMIAILATGCAGESAAVSSPEASVEEEAAETAAEEKTQAVSAVIYYGNANADGFDQKEVQLEALTPENLIAELAAVNVVSIDTEVNSFEQEGKSLKLDLSKGFSGYVNMMGTSGEYIVMGGLVNTFLTAYDGEEILITVDGKELETGHTLYDKPLHFFEPEAEAKEDTVDAGEKEPMSYRLRDEAYEQGGATIYYPQFTDMSDPSVQEKWNEALRELTVGVEEKRDSDPVCRVDYRIASCDTEFVSFVFTREIETGAETTTDIFAVSFDLVEGKNVRLSDWGEAMDTAAYNLANHGYYKILSDDVDREAYDEAMKMQEPDAEAYKKEFRQFDFDLEDLGQEPAGTSYVEDGELILIMEVPKELGGVLEIGTGIKVRE